jgi:hypothetical protein
MMWRKMRRLWYFACTVIGCAAVWGLIAMAKPVDEVVLTLGEPYEQVRTQSRSTLPLLTEDNSINLYVRRPAIFRFSDTRYGFATPPAKMLSLYTNQEGNVTLVTLSPQTETLPLDQAMAVMLDLQDQLQRHGWHPIRARRFPPISSTAAMIESIQRGDDPQTFWQAAGKYQVALDIRRFVHENRPNDERYLITLQLSGPPLMEDYPEDN